MRTARADLGRVDRVARDAQAGDVGVKGPLFGLIVDLR
jgi:hypothetical protein